MDYTRGNIMRIYLKNFLTYNEVEIRPKSHLNVLIGPNGTGKSAIVCGICIGLGGRPSLTGRGKEIVSYIKHGASKTKIEIELYVDQKSPSIVVSRTFDANGKSAWKMQHKDVLQKDVDAKVKELGIQVDNPCQFLPQDRVSDFAKMNQIQLLENTEKAVGEDELFRQHEILKENGKTVQDLKTQLTNLNSRLENEISRNARLSDQVKNNEKKERLELEIKELQSRRLWFLYVDLRNQVLSIRDMIAEKNQIIKAKIQKRCPLEKIANVAATKLTEKRVALKKCEDSYVRYQAQIGSLEEKFEKIEEEQSDAKAQYERKKAIQERSERDISAMKSQLNILQARLEEFKHLDDSEIQEKLKQLTSEITSVVQEQVSIQQQRDTSMMELKSLEQRLNSINREKELLHDLKHRRLQLLQVTDRDAYNAYMWLLNNRNQFQDVVHDPICIMVNIKKEECGKYIEDKIAKRDLVAFVCENKDDMNKLKRLMDMQKLRVNIIHSNCNDTSFKQPPAVPFAQIKSLGFESYMRELIEAPPAVLSFLCRVYRVHQVPVTTRNDCDFNKVPDFITNFYIGNSSFTKSRSRYDGTVALSIREVNVPKLLSISLNEKKVKMLEDQEKECESRIHLLKLTLSKLDQSEKQITRKLEEKRKSKQELNSVSQSRKQLQQRIIQKKAEISQKEQETVDLKAEEENMKMKLQHTTRNMVDLLKELKIMSTKAVDIVNNSMKTSCQTAAVRHVKKAYEEQLALCDGALQEEREELEEMNARKINVSSEASSSLKDLLKSLNLKSANDISDKQKKKFKTGLQGLQATEEKLAEVEALRDCIITADDCVVEEYKKREKEIEKLSEVVRKTDQSIAVMAADLEKSRSCWLPRVSELIGQISDKFAEYMARLGCAGEVLLEKGERADDFTKYGLSLRVKFRSNEQLRELTAKQQSGGERAVSTALYLLSLQALTKVPFRCVDEINQGMDPVNERKMFTMLVESTSTKTSSQYFLVTPKLLPNLPYNKRVTVLTVLNGKMMAPQNIVKFKQLLKKKRKGTSSYEGCGYTYKGYGDLAHILQL